MSAVPVGHHTRVPVCEVHLIDCQYDQPALFGTDRGWHEQGGGFFCPECDRIKFQKEIGPWESDPDMGD